VIESGVRIIVRPDKGHPPSPVPNMRAPRNVSDFLYQCANIGVTFLLHGTGLEMRGPTASIEAVKMAGYLRSYAPDILERLQPAPWDAPEFQVASYVECIELDAAEVEERAAIMSEGSDMSWCDALALARRTMREDLARAYLGSQELPAASF